LEVKACIGEERCADESELKDFFERNKLQFIYLDKQITENDQTHKVETFTNIDEFVYLSKNYTKTTEFFLRKGTVTKDDPYGQTTKTNTIQMSKVTHLSTPGPDFSFQAMLRLSSK
jgi:hypothetical protein